MSLNPTSIRSLLLVVVVVFQCIFVSGQNIGVRLRNTDGSDFRGTVEIRYNSSTAWGSICDDQWDLKDANVICKMLGFPSATYAHNESFFGEAVGQIYLDEVQCSGNEDTILECMRAPGWGVTDCAAGEHAGVTCFNGAITEAPEPPTVPNCTPRTDVRLTGGTSAVGRVEILRNGNWGTVCDDRFGINEARVVCSGLCYGTGYARPVKDLPILIAGGSVNILLDDLECDGTEDRLGDCTNPGWNVHDCEHKEDAQVSCINYSETGPPPPAPTVTCNENAMEIAFNRSTHSSLIQDDLSLAVIPNGCSFTRSTNESFIALQLTYNSCAESAIANETHITYTVNVSYHIDNTAQVITRTHEFWIPVHCALPRNSTADQPFLPVLATASPQWAEGEFNVEMLFFTDDNFRTPVSEYPLNLTLGDWVNVGVMLKSDDPLLKMIVPSCWATPLNRSDSTPRYPLINDKCPAAAENDDTLMLFPINETMFSFRVQSFDFVGDWSYVYIHCEVFVCMLSEKNAQCDQTCDSQTRRRRDVAQTHPGQLVEKGPIIILDGSELSHPVNEQSKVDDGLVSRGNILLSFATNLILASLLLII